MSTKNVIVASSFSNASSKVVTSATTLGQFKPEISELWGPNVDFVVKPGNVTLRGDDSLLPEGDFTLFIIPSKNKAGNISSSEAVSLGEEIKNAIVAAATKAEGSAVAELKNALIETIEDFFDVSLDAVANDCPECVEALAEAWRM